MDIFNPNIKFANENDNLVVLFDSQYEKDINRASKITYIPKPVESIETVVLKKTNAIALILKVTTQGKEQFIEIGQISNNAIDDEDDASISNITQGLADGVSKAFSQLYESSSQGTLNLGGEQLLTQPLYGNQQRQYINPEAPPKKRKFLGSAAITVGISLAAFSAVLGYMLLNDSNVDPIQAAVAQQMSVDPASIAAQVELTKETLSQMGIGYGTGSAGDLGCLAPQ